MPLFHMVILTADADEPEIPAVIGAIVIEGLFCKFLLFGFVFRAILFRRLSDSSWQKTENESEILRFIR